MLRIFSTQNFMNAIFPSTKTLFYSTFFLPIYLQSLAGLALALDRFSDWIESGSEWLGKANQIKINKHFWLGNYWLSGGGGGWRVVMIVCITQMNRRWMISTCRKKKLNGTKTQKHHKFINLMLFFLRVFRPHAIYELMMKEVYNLWWSEGNENAAINKRNIEWRPVNTIKASTWKIKSSVSAQTCLKLNLIMCIIVL